MKKYQLNIWLIIFSSLYVICVGTLVWCCNIEAQNITKAEISILTILSAIPAISIAVIAYFQLYKIASANVDSALIMLDNEWRSNNSVKARQIVDEIFQKTYRIDIESKGNFDYSMGIVSQKIYTIFKPSEESQLEDSNKKLIYLLSFIELMDTICFLYLEGEGHNKKQIKNLFKDSILFYYRVFRLYIESSERRSKSRFSNFIQVYNELK